MRKRHVPAKHISQSMRQLTGASIQQAAMGQRRRGDEAIAGFTQTTKQLQERSRLQLCCGFKRPL